MILGDGSRLANSTATLDDLFRRAGVRLPDALALVDPPNREVFTHDAPRKLSFAQTDRAISALAARLRGLGLQTDTVVAMQLPNTSESVIAFLGVLRAGMIAAPMPLLWRRHDIVAALRNVGAKAIITTSRSSFFRSVTSVASDAISLTASCHSTTCLTLATPTSLRRQTAQVPRPRTSRL
jgi:acyl-CoA synthetase (AMP-forming)/AMP-acid ligase II